MRHLSILALISVVGCGTPTSTDGQAFLADVARTHAAYETVSFSRHRINTPLRAHDRRFPTNSRDRWILASDGRFLRDIGHHAWGEGKGSWWGWTDKSSEVYVEATNCGPTSLECTVNNEPYGAILPPLIDLDRRFRAIRYEVAGDEIRVTAAPVEPMSAWWTRRYDPDTTTSITHVTFAFKPDHTLLTTTRFGANGSVFMTRFGDVVVDDPSVSSEVFEVPTQRPLRLVPKRVWDQARRTYVLETPDTAD